MINLSTNIENLNRIGKSRAKSFQKIDIKNVKDLIYYFPIKHKDRSKIYSIKEAKKQKSATIKASIKTIQNHRSYKTKTLITEVLVSDKTDSLKIVWFNQGFLGKILQKGKDYYFSGEIKSDTRYGFQMQSPVYEKADKNNPIHTARLVPFYPLTSGITQKQIRFLTNQALLAIKTLKDWLPKIIKNKYNLMDLDSALKEVHFPKNKILLQKAKKRLKFDEFFLIHLKNHIIKEKRKQKSAPSIIFKEKNTRKFVKSLNFDLTDAQKKAAWNIINDLKKNIPMNRLLEGDVGSGKTIVAIIGILNVVLSKFQVGYMAPTEILAKQHFNTLTNKLKNHSIALLTNNYSRIFKNNKIKELNKDSLIKKIKKGEILIIIGTHALIQKKIKFNKLGLIIIDEQHRFGVKQREKLNKKSGLKNLYPHFLSMSATPIPRSVALTLYGDLDLSVIDQMPPGRKKVETKIIKPEGRLDVYSFVKSEIKKGRQVFIICPLIDPSDKLGVKSANQEYEKINKEIFPKNKIGLLHGKLDSKEKQKTIENFEKGKIDILVSTTVVEVGIDIPNASIMIIEGAERFGLAQLHQLRGRIGRGNHKSYCFLFTNKPSNEKTLNRLNALLTSKNGFELAKKDLEIRGPGEVFGQKQSGFRNNLKIAELSDTKLIEQTKQAVNYLFQNNLKIKDYPELQKRVEKVNLSPHLE